MGCTKATFRSKRDAKRRLRQLQSVPEAMAEIDGHPSYGLQSSVYRCRDCGKWHLSTSSSGVSHAVQRQRIIDQLGRAKSMNA